MAPKPDYSDVEEMLFRGFLTLPAKINGVPVVFKTINTKEHDLVDLYASFDIGTQSHHAAYFLAYSVFLFNRVNILSDRETYVALLVEEFKNLSDKIVEYILQRLQILNNKASNALPKIKPYTFGNESRHNWFTYRSTLLNDSKVTGIIGTETLGINYHQKLWMFHNSTEDIQQQFDRDRELSKFEVSVHAPKGIKKIEARDKTAARDEARRRESLYLGEGKESIIEDGPNGEVKISDESVDDLMGQMKRSIEGQKDFHDRVVEEHEAKVRKQYEKERNRLRRRREMAQARRNEHLSGVSTKDPFLFYDEDEVQQQVAASKQRKAQHLREGRYQASAEFEQRGEHLAKWRIIDNEHDLQKQPATTPKSQDDSPFSGTVLEDHYRVVEEDMSYPDGLDYPDLLDDE